MIEWTIGGRVHIHILIGEDFHIPSAPNVPKNRPMEHTYPSVSHVISSPTGNYLQHAQWLVPLEPGLELLSISIIFEATVAL
jgi:hypothetical protein